MPDPQTTQEAARHATDPATVGAYAALIAAVGLAWRRIFGPKPAPKAHQPHDPGQAVATHADLEEMHRSSQELSKALENLRLELSNMPRRDDLKSLEEAMQKGFERVTEAGERRVQALHARLDGHLQAHINGSHSL